MTCAPVGCPATHRFSFAHSQNPCHCEEQSDEAIPFNVREDTRSDSKPHLDPVTPANVGFSIFPLREYCRSDTHSTLRQKETRTNVRATQQFRTGILRHCTPRRQRRPAKEQMIDENHHIDQIHLAIPIHIRIANIRQRRPAE